MGRLRILNYLDDETDVTEMLFDGSATEAELDRMTGGSPSVIADGVVFDFDFSRQKPGLKFTARLHDIRDETVAGERTVSFFVDTETRHQKEENA